MTDLVERLREYARRETTILGVWRSHMLLAADEITRLTASVAELEANTIPKLPDCGQFLAKDCRGQWHYINHAGTWQGMPDLLKDARAKALREAAEHAVCHFDDRPLGRGMDFEDGYRDATRGASKAILALLNKEEGE